MWITSARGDLVNLQFIVAFGIKCIADEDEALYYVRGYTETDAYWNMDGPFKTKEEAELSLNRLAANLMEAQCD